MKLTCPKCLSYLKTPDTSVPPGGGWARCPKCTEKFFVAAPGKGLDLLSELPRVPASGRAGRDQESQRMLDRLRAARGQEPQDPQDWATASGNLAVTIFPEPALSPGTVQAIGLVLLGLPLLILAIIFFSAEPQEPPSNPVRVFERKFNNESNADLIRADLVALRKKIVSRQRGPYIVEHTGAESRVFKYFAGLMAPGKCDAFVRLDVEPGRSGRGYTATAACSEGTLSRLRMEVIWTDRTARIHFPDYPEIGRNEFEMFPIVPMTTAAARTGGGR